MPTRREFSKAISLGTAGLALSSLHGTSWADHHEKPLFKISLAQWSLHKALFGDKLNHLDFAAHTKKHFDIDAVEYVNQFFKDKANDKDYLAQMNQRASDAGVKNLLIMVDGEGKLGDANLRERLKSVEKHYKWVEAAKTLGCHSIRVNASSSGSYEDQQSRAADGLRALTEFAADHDINVIVENHGGLSSDGKWLAGTIAKVGHLRCGTLPDFGNFAIDRANNDWFDRYEGVRLLMPFAKAVSAKTHNFDDKKPMLSIDNGGARSTNYEKMMKIVLDAGYDGYVGIEFEGAGDEGEGIMSSKALLERARKKLS